MYSDVRVPHRRSRISTKGGINPRVKLPDVTESDPVRPSLDEMAIEDAVEVVLESEAEETDRETVHTTLEQVSEGGVVSREAANSAIGHVSKVVSTPETRLEFAQQALADAKEAATPIDDLGAVRSRLDTHEARLHDIETGVEDLGEDLQRLVSEEEIYTVAVGLRTLRSEANELQHRADVFQHDLKNFEVWLENPDQRFDELAQDVAELADALDELEKTGEAIEEAAAADERISEGHDTRIDPAVAWGDATLRQRVMGLFVTDLRAELDDLRAWSARMDLADEHEEFESGSASLQARIDEVEKRSDRLAARLARLSDPDWEARFGSDVAALEDAIASFEPPIMWDEVEAVLEDQRLNIADRG